MNQTEIAIVGGGIVGLAAAYHHAKQGRQVTLFERDTRALGASIRNFGMIWPIGQPSGKLLQRALRSREIWLELHQKAGLFADEVGSIMLAYRPEEVAVLEEFQATSRDKGFRTQLLTPEEVPIRSSAAKIEGLRAALWSETEVIVDARLAIQKLHAYLAEEMRVQFIYQTAVTEISDKQLLAAKQVWTFEQAWVCTGADFETLFPEVYQNARITKCKLQMMRTAPQADQWRLGPSLYGGLTLAHYASFAHCESLQAWKEVIKREMPWSSQWGIHVMASQNGIGEVIIGDSHEYGPSHDPFIRQDINRYIFDYLRGFMQLPDMEIAEYWYGIYPKLTDGGTELVIQPQENITIVNGVGGAGMTLSFGLLEELI